jgi:pimeloyl-ACP methyl ester carboxylesterase
MPRVLFAAVLVLLMPGTAQAPPPVQEERNPVVLVHGYNADPRVWGSLREDLKADGYSDTELFSWGYDTHRSVNETLSGRFAAYVDDVRRRTGATRVDVVSHSFGSLVTRWYVTYGGGGRTVDRWVSLGGPNHGTSTAWACALWDQACRDMTPGSYVQKRLAEGDETPGDVRYGTWWSGCDEVINPDSSVPLSGAVNHAAGCLDHNELLGDEGVSAGVRAFTHWDGPDGAHPPVRVHAARRRQVGQQHEADGVRAAVVTAAAPSIHRSRCRAVSYSPALPIAMPACEARTRSIARSSSVNGPPRFPVRWRWPNASVWTRTGTPRPSGPSGRRPMCRRSSSVMPTVYSSAGRPRSGSTTARAPVRASVSSAADSTRCWRVVRSSRSVPTFQYRLEQRRQAAPGHPCVTRLRRADSV